MTTLRRPEASHDSREADRGTQPTRAELARLLRDALAHLHDPVHLQTSPLTRFVADEARARAPSRGQSLGRALGQALLEAIEALRPSQGPSLDSRSSLSHQVLRLRYAEGLEVRAIQDRLAISRTTYYREQERALSAMASYLGEKWLGERWPGEGWPGGRREQAESGVEPIALRVAEPTRPLHNLPVQLTSFVGREREIAEVRRLLGTTRLLTLTGTGGCGKTRLAYRVAAQLAQEQAEELPDGVWMVELAPLSDPGLVPQAIALALGVRERPGQPVLETLLSYLKPRRLLLVLDNCEHLVDGCARLAEKLLLGCPHLRILATSREPLTVSGENVWRVPSLASPDPHNLPSVDRLAGYEAVRLFVERAEAAQPSFQMTERSAPALAQVVARLDGIPLAIELAAARVRVLSVQQIADRLDDRFSLLTGGGRTALPRQQTLRGALDWSHDLLSDSERVLFRRLAVFVGGWTLEAAEAVCADAGGAGVDSDATVGRGEVLDLLTRLVDRSLVVVEVRGEARYRLLETIREYAREKLLRSVEMSATQRRHRDHYLAFAEKALPGIARRDQLPGLALLEPEHDNVRSALDWSRGEPDGAAYELRLALTLASLWFHRGYRDEARVLLPDLLARTKDVLPDTRGALLGWAGAIQLSDGNPSRARECFEESLALGRAVGNNVTVALALECLAGLAGDVGSAGEARALLEEALPIARASGDRLATVAILVSLGDLLTRQGDEAAESCLEEAAAIAGSAGDRWLRGGALMGLALLMLRSRDYQRARTLIDEAVAVWGDRVTLTGALGLPITQGDLARAEGDPDGAGAFYRKALVEARDRTAAVSMTLALERLADLWAAVGQSQRATRLYGALDAWRTGSGIPVLHHPHPSHESDLGAALAALGEVDYAHAWAEGQAMTLEQAVEYALEEIDQLRVD